MNNVLYFYCQNCCEVTTIDMSGVMTEIEKIPAFKDTSNSLMINSIQCSHCGSHVTFDIDEYIIPSVKLANSKGYVTSFSCSGHYDANPLYGCPEGLPYIVLECTPYEKEIISKIEHDECLDVNIEDRQIISNGEIIYSKITVSIYYQNNVNNLHELIHANKMIYDFISKFPESNSFRKGMYINLNDLRKEEINV